MNRYLVFVFFFVTKMGSEVAALTLGEAFKHVKAWGKENKLYSVAHSLNHSLKERQLVTSWKWKLSRSSPPCSTMGWQRLRGFQSMCILKAVLLPRLCYKWTDSLNSINTSEVFPFLFLCVYRHLYVCVFMQTQTDRQIDVSVHICL